MESSFDFPSIFSPTEFNETTGSASFLKLASYMHEKYTEYLISSLTSSTSCSDLVDHWKHAKSNYFDSDDRFSQLQEENQMLLRQNQELQILILALNSRFNSEHKQTDEISQENSIPGGKKPKLTLESDSAVKIEDENNTLQQKCVICRKEVEDFSNHKCFEIESEEDENNTPQNSTQVNVINPAKTEVLTSTENSSTNPDKNIKVPINTELIKFPTEIENTSSNITDTDLGSSSDVLKEALPSLLLQLQKSTNNNNNQRNNNNITENNNAVHHNNTKVPDLTPSGKPRSRTLKTCPICQKEIYNLPDHMKTHSNERPYACNLCPISFKRKGDLNRHIRNTEN